MGAPGLDARGHPTRAVATRYDKLAVRYEITAQIAAINDWLLRLFKDTA